jgi:hypothetical protein
VLVKLPIGTASRGVWQVDGPAKLAQVAADLDRLGAYSDGVVVQDFVAGPIEHAQAVFAHGRLLACHGYRQILRGLGGGEALKESVDRPLVRDHLARLGAALEWHGALSVDYVFADESRPLYFDCNPRLVEPMAARLAGLDLTELLVQVSLGRASEALAGSRAGVRTQLALQGILGEAARSGSRWSVARRCWELAAKRGPFAGAREELTPFAADPPSIVPTVFAALLMLARPDRAESLAKGGWGTHLLDIESARAIRAWAP